MPASTNSKARKTPRSSLRETASRAAGMVFGAVAPKSREIRFSFALSAKERNKIKPGPKPLIVRVGKQHVDEFMESLRRMFEAVGAEAEMRRTRTDADLCDEEDAAVFNAVGKGKRAAAKG